MFRLLCRRFRSPKACKSQPVPRVRLGFDGLESRENPSGNVLASVVGGDLLLTGDGHALGNQVSIQEKAQGIFEISGSTGTTINGGASVTLTGVSRDFKATFKGGPDSLVFNPLGISPLTHLRDLKIDMGAGSDVVSLKGFHARNVSVNQPNSESVASHDQTVIVAGVFGIGSITGNITISNGKGQDFTDLLVDLAGSVSVSHADGEDSVRLNVKCGGVAISSPGSLYTDVMGIIGKNLKITSGGTFGGSNFLHAATIQGNVTLTSTLPAGVQVTHLVGVDIAGKLAITCGAGSDNIIFDNLTVAKNLSLKAGQGQNWLDVRNGCTVGGKFTYTAGNADDRILTDNSANQFGAVQFALGDGDNSFGLEGITVDGDAFISAGKHDDKFSMDGVGSFEHIGGRFSINLGDGNNNLRIFGDTTFVGGKLKVQTGGGEDVVTLAHLNVGGSATVLTGGAYDDVGMYDSSYGSHLLVDVGAGADFLNFENYSASGAMTVGGNLSLFGGSDQDHLSMSYNQGGVDVLGATSLSGFESQTIA